MPRFLRIRSLMVATLSTSRITWKSAMDSPMAASADSNRTRVSELGRRRISFSCRISSRVIMELWESGWVFASTHTR